MNDDTDLFAEDEKDARLGVKMEQKYELLMKRRDNVMESIEWSLKRFTDVDMVFQMKGDDIKELMKLNMQIHLLEELMK